MRTTEALLRLGRWPRLTSSEKHHPRWLNSERNLPDFSGTRWGETNPLVEPVDFIVAAVGGGSYLTNLVRVMMPGKVVLAGDQVR